LRRHLRLHVFFADDVWGEVASRTPENALELELKLAGLTPEFASDEIGFSAQDRQAPSRWTRSPFPLSRSLGLADALVILVESAGTIAELGAFASLPQFRGKLLPILPREYVRDSSFINSGPVRWVNDHSLFAPVISADFSTILACAGEIEVRLSRIAPLASGIKRKRDLLSDSRFSLFLVCELVNLLGPVTQSHLKYYLQQAFEAPDTLDTGYLLGLAQSIGVVDSFLHQRLGQFFFPRLIENQFHSVLDDPPFSIPKTRARVLADLQRIPDFAALLDTLGGQSFSQRRADAS
jgi:hypothetical protein